MSETGQLSVEKLQKELSLKQLQINSLLTITQAINDNVAAPELYSMYKSFIGWEMGIKRMALFFRNEDVWECVTQVQAEHLMYQDHLGPQLKKFSKTQRITSTDPEPFQGFDLIIPVYHKSNPIAFALIGGMRQDGDDYTRIQFITTFTNIIAVAIENKRLFKRQIEQERFARDLELASHVQKMLIPNHLPISKYFEMDTVYKPHQTVGGDYFDFIQHNDRKITFCIADISGKGISAAILMANFQATLQNLINQYKDLETFMYALNEAVYRITRSDRFITLFIGQLDLQKNKLEYINAGHFPPFLIQNNEIIRLETGCTIIGAFETLPDITLGKVQLNYPGVLFACTDGITDVTDDQDVYFDDWRIAEILKKADQYVTAGLLNEALISEVDNFRGKRPYPDDIALMSLKYTV